MSKTDVTVERTVRNPLFVVLVLLCVLLVGGIYTITSLRDVTDDLSSQTTTAQETRTRILNLQQQINDCLDPNKQCAKVNQTHTLGILAATAYCSRTLPATVTRDATLRCVVRSAIALLPKSTPTATASNK